MAEQEKHKRTFKCFSEIHVKFSGLVESRFEDRLLAIETPSATTKLLEAEVHALHGLNAAGYTPGNSLNACSVRSQ